MPDPALDDRLSRRLGVLVAFALCAIHVGSFDVVKEAIQTDVRFYLYFSWQVSEGAVPHRDYFDMKNQLASFTGALFHAIGMWMGQEPLFTTRRGFLLITLLGGMLAYLVMRRIGGNRATAGILGVLAYCSFGLIGALPGIGPVPKLWMALAAAAAALCIHSQRWLLAGLCGAVAFMDWQIGALVWLAALATALVCEDRPKPAITRLVAGGTIGVAPMFLYYTFTGALGAWFEQGVLVSFFRGANRGKLSFGDRLERIDGFVTQDCAGQEWLFWASFAGIFVALFLCWLWRRDDRLRLVLPLTLFHGAIVVFTALDFQGQGDLMALSHSLAFFQALVWVALAVPLAVWLTKRAAPRLAIAASGVVVIALAGYAAKPGPLRPLQAWQDPTRQTLSAQAEVARKVGEFLGERSIAALDSIEYLYLLQRTNRIPAAYYTRPVRDTLLDDPEATMRTGAARLLQEAGADVWIYHRKLDGPHLQQLEEQYSATTIRSMEIPSIQLTVHSR